MTELQPSSEAKSPNSIIQEEIDQYIKGLAGDNLGSTVFQNYCNIFRTLDEVHKAKEKVKSAKKSDKITARQNLHELEERFPAIVKVETDSCSTVPGYYDKYAALAQQVHKWISQYGQLSNTTSINAMMTVIKMVVTEDQTSSDSLSSDKNPNKQR